MLFIYLWGRFVKKCIGCNLCIMWSVNWFEWLDLSNVVEIKGKE